MSAGSQNYRTRSAWRSIVRRAWFPTLLALLCAAGWARGRGYKTWVYRQFNPEYGVRHYADARQPSVIRTRPADREATILPGNAFVAADVELPFDGKVVDGRTLTPDAVKLYRTRDHRSLTSVVNTSGAGDAIVLRPVDPLETNTQYTFEVTSRAKDTGGHSFRPYQATFWTAAGQKYSDFPAAFEKVPQPIATGNMFTCVTMGPDHKLYASSLTGHIFRFTISPDGTLGNKQTIDSVNTANGKLRLITGLTFDPAATADHLMLWVSHGELPSQGEQGQAWIRGASDWSGKISRLEGADLDQYHDVIVHLPRAWKDHLNNQMAFGPDGALYFCQAANTAMGAPDHKWGYRPERLLTAAVLRVNVNALAGRTDAINVQTDEGGYYNPFAPDAPLTIYATGIRNSYDLVWHSNGHLYGGINGSASGGNTPASPATGFESLPRIDSASRGSYPGTPVPALNNVVETEDDVLLKIESGGYYGHPNPLRAEYVLNGGNPLSPTAPYIVAGYPKGTQPDRNWRSPTFSFGKNLSPCGAIEYQSGTFGGALKHKLIYVRYSGGDDLVVLTLDANGDVAESITGIEGCNRFVNPVDLIEDPASGSLYVAEFGGKRITLLRPILATSPLVDSASHHVCRLQVNPTVLSSGRE